MEVFRLLQIVRLPPEFLSRPPSGATLPPGEGIAAFGVPATPGGVALRGNPMRNPALLVIHKKLSILFVQTVLYYHQRAPGMG